MKPADGLHCLFYAPRARNTCQYPFQAESKQALQHPTSSDVNITSLEQQRAAYVGAVVLTMSRRCGKCSCHCFFLPLSWSSSPFSLHVFVCFSRRLLPLSLIGLQVAVSRDSIQKCECNARFRTAVLGPIQSNSHAHNWMLTQSFPHLCVPYISCFLVVESQI
jgi:hypothetical protein